MQSHHMPESLDLETVDEEDCETASTYPFTKTPEAALAPR